MKTVISGRLIEEPELRKVKLSDGTEMEVCNYEIWVADPTAPTLKAKNGREYKRDVAFRCTAWGENAKAIAELEKNSTLTGSYVMKYNNGYPNYVIKRIDKENKLQKQMSDLLSAYEENKINDIVVPDQQPSFNKDVNKTAEKEVEKDKTADKDTDKEK